MDVVGRRGADLLDHVDNVAQQVAGEHAVVPLLEYCGEDVAWVALAAPTQNSQARQQIVVDEAQQRIAGQAAETGYRWRDWATRSSSDPRDPRRLASHTPGVEIIKL